MMKQIDKEKTFSEVPEQPVGQVYQFRSRLQQIHRAKTTTATAAAPSPEIDDPGPSAA